MIFPSLTDVERAVLEEMAAHGPTRLASVPIRGRLALYKLIDEKPEGWTITALGRRALHDAPSASMSESFKEEAGRAPGRHYGKKSRKIWFG